MHGSRSCTDICATLRLRPSWVGALLSTAVLAISAAGADPADGGASAEDAPHARDRAVAADAGPAGADTGSGERDGERDEDEDGKPRIHETIEVTAGLEEVASAPHGASTSVLHPEQLSAASSNLARVLAFAPGVSENGQGGLFQVFSVRGVSRQRLITMISGMRVTSERRAGVSTSFVDPLLFESIEVVRGPSTTLNGSGALGGVIQLAPRRFGAGGTAIAGYDSDGSQRYVVGGTGGKGWSAGVAHRSADDGETPDGTRLNTAFEQTSAVLSGRFDRGPRKYEVTFIPSLGRGIDKDNVDFPERTTVYPLERHQMLKFAMTGAGAWRLTTFVHAQDLETDVTEEDSRSRVFNETLDYGANWESQRGFGSAATLRYGVGAFGRTGVDAIELLELDGMPEPIRSNTLDDAHSIEAGTFATLRWVDGASTYEGGARLSWIDQGNGTDSGRDRSAWNGFLGYSNRLSERWLVRASVSTGLRFPSLTELFFSGTTARGEVIGNPDLRSERSFNAETSLRYVRRSLLVQGAVFRNRITNYVERDEFAPDMFRFVNIGSGTIEGVELQALVRPAENWRILWGGHVIDGEAADGRPLEDIPATEVFLGVERSLDRFTFDGRLAHRASKSDLASGEKAIPSAQLLSASVGYRVGPQWSVALEGSNLLDESYFRAADRKASLAAGRAVGFRLSWTGAPR